MTGLPKDSRKWNYLLWFFAIISCIMTLIPLRYSLLSCDDSISNFVYARVTNFNYSFNSAFKFSLMRGKFGYLFPTVIAVRDYLYRHGNYVIYWLMQYVPVYINVFLMAGFVGRKLSKNLAPVSVTIFTAFLQVNGWHSLITCYPIEFMYGLTMALLGVMLFDACINPVKEGKPNKLLMAVSVLCFYESMQTYEAFLLFALFYALLAFYSKDSWKKRIKVLIPHIVTGVIYVAIFVYLNLFPVVESNGYNVTTRGSFGGLIITDLIFSFGMFPLADIFFPSVRHGIRISDISPSIVILTIAAVLGIFIFLNVFGSEIKNRRKYIHAGIIGLTMALVFPLMHSMTSKYQTWAIKEHQFGYVPTTISYFGWVLAIVAFVAAFYSFALEKKPKFKKALISIVAVLVGLITFTTGLINASIRVNGIGPTSQRISYRAQSMYFMVTSDEFKALSCDLLYAPDYVGVHNLFVENETIIQYETKNGISVNVTNDLEEFNQEFLKANSPLIYRYFFKEDVGVLIVPSSNSTGSSLYVISSHGFNGNINVNTADGNITREAHLKFNEVLTIDDIGEFDLNSLNVNTIN